MMNSIEDIRRLSNDELFRELRKRGLNPGPVSPTTRNIYEKKLGAILFGPKLSPPIVSSSTEVISEEDVSNYSDEELFKALKDRGQNPGPIMPTTRIIYEKKLLNLIKSSKLPGYPNLDRSVSASPIKNTKESPSQSEFDSEVPKTSEKKVPSLFPSLEFKLIDKETRKVENNEDSFMKINNFEKSNKLWKFSHPNDKNNGSYLDYIQPKSQMAKKELSKPNRRLNLNAEIFENRNSYSEKDSNQFFSMSSVKNLYDEPPPPQPILNSNLNQKKYNLPDHNFSLSEFMLENYKLIFIIISILIFLSMVFSNSNDNPIDL